MACNSAMSGFVISKSSFLAAARCIFWAEPSQSAFWEWSFLLSLLWLFSGGSTDPGRPQAGCGCWVVLSRLQWLFSLAGFSVPRFFPAILSARFTQLYFTFYLAVQCSLQSVRAWHFFALNPLGAGTFSGCYSLSH